MERTLRIEAMKQEISNRMGQIMQKPGQDIEQTMAAVKNLVEEFGGEMMPMEQRDEKEEPET